MTRPIPGAGQAPQYRNSEGAPTMRCSLCHREYPQSSIVRNLASDEKVHTIAVGPDLLGFICKPCAPSFYERVIGMFPDSFAFPFVDERSRVIPNPRCEKGHALKYADDGRQMLCRQCDLDRCAAAGPEGQDVYEDVDGKPETPLALKLPPKRFY